MKSVSFILAAFIAAPAFGQDASDPVEIANCGFQPSPIGGNVIECDVTNTSDSAIAEMGFAFRVAENGRSVAWVEEGFSGMRPHRMRIPGGVEPGETARLFFGTFREDERMDMSAIYIEAFATEVLNADGAQIPY